ncbi:hypothetical protein ACFL35_21920 [Candidatus Riflebacteria bacterium]
MQSAKALYFTGLLLLITFSLFAGDAYFDLGEEQVYGKSESKVEIEEIGDTTIPDYIFKTDLYSSTREEAKEKTIENLELIQKRKKKNRAYKSRFSRFLKRGARAGIGSFGTFWADVEFDIRNKKQDDFHLNLNFFNTDGYRDNNGKTRFGSGIHWERGKKEKPTINLDAGVILHKKDLPGPTDNIQSDASVEDAIQNIILSYELTKNLADRLKIKARYENLDRNIKFSGAKEKQEALLARLDLQYFTFVRERYSVHFGGGISQDKMQIKGGEDFNADSRQMYVGVEGTGHDTWGYYLQLRLAEYKKHGSELFPSILLNKKLNNKLKLGLEISRDDAFDKSVRLLTKYEDLKWSNFSLPIKRRFKILSDYEPSQKTNLSLQYFYDDYKNYLSFNDIPDNQTGLTRITLDNIKDATVNGVITELEHKLNNFFTFSANLLFQRADDDNLDSDIPFVPDMEHTYKLRYKNSSGLTAEAASVYRSSLRTSRGTASDKISEANLTHMGLGYQKNENIHFDFKIKNLYDKYYEIRRKHPGPGREYQLEMKYIY